MDKESIEQYKQAGKIAGQAREYGVSLMKADSKIKDVLDSIEKVVFGTRKKKSYYVSRRKENYSLS